MTGEDLLIEFAHIIERRQPEPNEIEQVNVWLQRIFRVAISGVDSAPYIQQIKEERKKIEEK